MREVPGSTPGQAHFFAFLEAIAKKPVLAFNRPFVLCHSGGGDRFQTYAKKFAVVFSEKLCIVPCKCLVYMVSFFVFGTVSTIKLRKCLILKQGSF